MLTDRQKDILKILTNEYIKEFSPISSNYLVSKCGLDFSSATIRNELSILEDYGYLKRIIILLAVFQLIKLMSF